MDTSTRITMRTRPVLVAVLLGTLLVAAGCTAPQPERRPEPRPTACSDSVYLKLTGEHPDSLSDRAWERLQQLEAACERDRSRVDVTRDDHHRESWIWMPTMMVLGTLMWLVMGGGH